MTNKDQGKYVIPGHRKRFGWKLGIQKKKFAWVSGKSGKFCNLL